MNVILRTAQQSHPLRRGRLPAYRPVSPHPAHAFAVALATRYGRLPGAEPPIGAILARPPQAGAAATSSRMVVHRHDHRHLTRLRLTFSTRWRQLLYIAAPASAAAVPTGAGSAPRSAHLHFRSNETQAGNVLNLVLNRPGAPTATLHLKPQIVQQLVARTHRISLLQETSAPATTGADTVPRPAPPVRRQVRRPAPAERENRPVGPTQAREEGAAHRPVAPPRPVRLDNTEINRVTDHVLRTIDRQMWARRERTGRV